MTEKHIYDIKKLIELIYGDGMTENKRFRISQGYTDRFCHDWQNNQLLNFRETVELLNELVEENHFLKEKEKDMLNYLKQEYDYVYKQRMKHLDDAVLTRCYEMIEYHIRSMIEHLEGL